MLIMLLGSLGKGKADANLLRACRHLGVDTDSRTIPHAPDYSRVGPGIQTTRINGLRHVKTLKRPNPHAFQTRKPCLTGTEI
jgi:hypothetical protein